MDREFIKSYMDGNLSGEAAAPFIKDWAMKILKEHKDQPVPLKFIKEEIMIKSGIEFSPGSYSGAMRDLIEENRGRIVNQSRGQYMYVSDAKRHAINSVLEDTISKLNDLAYDNILTLTHEDLDAIGKIPRLIDHIKALKIPKD